MGKRVGLLGCGKIGGAVLEHILDKGEHSVSFILARTYQLPADKPSIPVLRAMDEELLKQTDLVVEAATPDVLKEHLDVILRHCDIMVLSMTAFSDPDFETHARELCAQTGHSIYLAHGAILGLDGLRDGGELITQVSITTTKPPASLQRTDVARTVLYDGPTRDACRQFPRNVNVHAVVALAGLGFDKTRSVIISDPAVTTNGHNIDVVGEGIHFNIDVKSFATGGVTGKYTPYSACGSLDAALNASGGLKFI